MERLVPVYPYPFWAPVELVGYVLMLKFLIVPYCNRGDERRLYWGEQKLFTTIGEPITVSVSLFLMKFLEN